MEKVVVDNAIQKKLEGFTAPVEFCDRHGRILGHFLPLAASPKTYSADRCPYTEDELAQMQHERAGRTLDEIWKSLGQT